MSGLRRFTMHPDRLRAEHERARILAATGLVEALSPADAAALAAHLDTCRECRQAALDYAFQGERIHTLPSIDLPRDAWPAFAARLDTEEARTAEQRARRAGSRRVASQAHPLGTRPSRAPGAFVPVAASVGGGHRGAPVAASVGVGSILALVATVALVASGLPQMIVGPAATPFAVDPSSVAWVTRQADGRFVLQTAAFDSACPSGGAACSDLAQRASTIVALDMEPASVFLAHDGRDAIVVDVGAAGAGTSGGSVYAIELPTPYPGSAGAVRTPAVGAILGGPTRPSDLPGGIAAGAALATAVATAAAVSPGPSSSPRRSPVPEATPPYPTARIGAEATRGPVASFVTAGGPGASLPAAVPLPTAAATRAIAEDVILVGGRAGYSRDGRWFAFSARSADSSTGPSVYLWRVGDERSRAVTSGGAAVFAGWVGDRMLVSSPDGEVGKIAPETPAAAGVAKGGTSAASAAPEDAADGGTSTDAAGTGPSSTVAADATVDPGAAAPDAPLAGSAGDGATGERGPPGASAAPSNATSGPVTTPASYLLDPRTGDVTPIDLPGLWLPSVDPTGTRVVAWLGTVRADPATGAWRPAAGSLVVGSWPTVLAGVAASPEPTAAPSDGSASTPVATGDAAPDAATAASDSPEAAVAEGAADAASAEPDASAPTAEPAADDAAPSVAADAGAATPDPDASARPTAAAAGAPGRPDAAPSATAGAAGASPGGAPIALSVAGLSGILPPAWQVRWDQTGTHLAIWIADPEAPEVGRLTLLAVDPDRAGAPAVLLSSTPAMPGFAMGKSRIAWATPADGTPAGGRVRVLVWSGPGVGEAGTEPIRGLETLVEAD